MAFTEIIERDPFFGALLYKIQLAYEEKLKQSLDFALIKETQQMNSSPSAYQILVEEYNQVKTELNRERQFRQEADRKSDTLEHERKKHSETVKDKDA